jgi:hypothetical protein
LSQVRGKKSLFWSAGGENENLWALTLFTVKIVRINIAALHESSAFAESGLREFSRLLRRAVGLGRSCLDHLAVLAALLNLSGNELLSLQLHPLQAALPKAKWRASLEAPLVTTVSLGRFGIDSLDMTSARRLFHHSWRRCAALCRRKRTRTCAR